MTKVSPPPPPPPTTTPMMILQATGGVRFHHRVRIRNVSSHKDFTREEKARCWYTGQDFVQMKQEVANYFLNKKRRMNMAKNNNNNNNNNMKQQQQEEGDDEEGLDDSWEALVATGLETPDNCRSRRAKIQAAKLTVLIHQERLWNEQKQRAASTITSTPSSSAAATTTTGATSRDEDRAVVLSIQSQWATVDSRDEALQRAAIVYSQVHHPHHPHPDYHHHHHHGEEEQEPRQVEVIAESNNSKTGQEYQYKIPPMILGPTTRCSSSPRVVCPASVVPHSVRSKLLLEYGWR